MTGRSSIRKVQMWGVFAPGQKKPLGLCETRKKAREMQRAYDRFVKGMGKRK